MTTRDNFPTRNRCDVCEASFTTEALLHDHRRLHEAKTPEEQAAILEEQGERKP
jgi:hypothetical protein